MRALKTHLYTLHLFTKADYKTILFPITVFGCVVGPVSNWRSFASAVLWIWLHLLNCNISNQYKSKSEDLVNKPWRPLPSNRISEGSARILRWYMPIICLIASGIFNWKLALVSFSLTITTIVYDEIGAAGHWFGKNVSGISGYSSFEVASTMLMSNSKEIDSVALMAFLCSAFIILTTLHAQDFADVIGDSKGGRKTFPIRYPTASRISISTGMVLWSILLCRIWSIGPVCSLAFILFGCWLGARFWFSRSTDADRLSYVFYNVWLLCALLLPSNARWGILAH